MQNNPQSKYVTGFNIENGDDIIQLVDGFIQRKLNKNEIPSFISIEDLRQELCLNVIKKKDNYLHYVLTYTFKTYIKKQKDILLNESHNLKECINLEDEVNFDENSFNDDILKYLLYLNNK